MEIHARIARWAIVRLREPGRPSTFHIVGYIVDHRRLEPGQPYIGSSLAALDIAQHTARNRRSRHIMLEGDPLPLGDLPVEILAMLCRATKEWRLAIGSTWDRVDSIEE